MKKKNSYRYTNLMEAKRSEKINKNKRYNTYLVHSNYHQIWKNNKMPTEREREREREREIYG